MVDEVMLPRDARLPFRIQAALWSIKMVPKAASGKMPTRRWVGGLYTAAVCNTTTTLFPRLEKCESLFSVYSGGARFGHRAGIVGPPLGDVRRQYLRLRA